MTRVWKFGPFGFNWKTVEMDGSAVINHFGIQHGEFFFWADTDPDEILVRRTFAVFATGQDVPEDCWYGGTVIAPDMTVWHLFEKVG